VKRIFLLLVQTLSIMDSISALELKERLDKGEQIQLIDVREAYELEIAKIGGLHIPMNEILANVDKIPRDKMVVVYCRSGKRSASVIGALEERFGFENLYNLDGGILEWQEDVDNDMERY
jgi:adenylyltransferase/sulfurtransferase